MAVALLVFHRAVLAADDGARTENTLKLKLLDSSFPVAHTSSFTHSIMEWDITQQSFDGLLKVVSAILGRNINDHIHLIFSLDLQYSNQSRTRGGCCAV